MKTGLCLLIAISVVEATVADELQPIPLQETIPAAPSGLADQPELLPPAQAVDEEPSSFNITPPVTSSVQSEFDPQPVPDIVVEESTVLGDQTLESGRALTDNPVALENQWPEEVERLVIPQDLGLPCIELRAPHIVVRPVVIQPPALMVARPVHTVVVHPGHIHAIPHAGFVPPPSSGPVTIDLVALEVAAPPVLIPGQPVRNMLRFRRAGLFR